MIGAVGFCAVFAEGASLDWSAVYLRDVLDASPGPAAASTTSFALTMAVARLAGDRVADRFGPVRTVRVGGVAATAGGLLVVMAPHPVLAMAGFALMGLGVAVVVPLAFAAAGRSGPNPSQAIAGVATITYTSGLIAPSAIGAVADATSLVVSFGLVTVLAFGLVVGRGYCAARAASRRHPAARCGRPGRRSEGLGGARLTERGGRKAPPRRARTAAPHGECRLFSAVAWLGPFLTESVCTGATMKLGVRWTLHGDGRTPAPGAVVRPDERLSWPRTAGLGAQHVVAMFGASFVAPVLMGLDPNLAIMMSGVATVIFLLATRGRVPSYLGCSLSFVGVAATIRASGGDSATVTGAVLVVGLTLFLAGLAVQKFGARIIHAAMPPVVTGAVVMLIGFNLAPVTASTYWPQDQWTALLVMLFTGLAVVCLRGFFSRIAIFLGLLFGYGISWLFDRLFGKIHSPAGGAEAVDHWRLDLSAVGQADWIGLPSFHAPSFEWSAILVALPVVIALIAENAGHVKAVGEMTGDPLDDKLGTAIAADGIGSMLSTAVGGPPNTTYSENIGVMAATRVYSTAAYWAAAGFALLFGLCPKFGAVVAAIPGGVLGGITVILYGMIGLLGAQIWTNARVDLRNPLNLVPAAAGIIIGVGGVSLKITDNFELGGIALGTIVVITGYHVLRALAPAHLREQEPLLDAGTSRYDTETGKTGPSGD